MKFVKIIFCISLLVGCNPKKTEEAKIPDIDLLAKNYVTLCLAIGQYDTDFVDAYYGPDSLKPALSNSKVFPKDSFLAVANTLTNQLSVIGNDSTNISASGRAKWINNQLTALKRRVRIFSGEFGTFDEESKDLFGVVAPTHPESHFQQLISELDSLLPGDGTIAARFQKLSSKFELPVSKLDAIFKTTIAEARKRTLQHYPLPAGENFQLEFVKDKSWSGYNWYKGKYNSLIQINTDLPILAERAIDLGCHEGYPGHHVYNMLLEKSLYTDSGWVEISLYPLYSPQSLIAEGSGNYGIELAFPGEQQMTYTRDVILPMAGIDTAGIAFYFKALELKSKLNFARNEVARGIINGNMTETEGLRWLVNYNLYTDASAAKSMSFIKKYRSYVINYNYGLELVKNYVESRSKSDTAKRWEVFQYMLSNPVTTEDLQAVN